MALPTKKPFYFSDETYKEAAKLFIDQFGYGVTPDEKLADGFNDIKTAFAIPSFSGKIFLMQVRSYFQKTVLELQA